MRPLDVTTIILLWISQISFNAFADVLEVCNREHLNISCEQNQVVLVANAIYGRMRKGRCVQRDLGFLGCHINVRDKLDAICSGRRRCGMKLPDDNLYEYLPCPLDTTSYLEIDYTCLTVATSSRQECDVGGIKRQLTTTPLYVSNILSEQLAVGSIHCPWIFQVNSGQRINITLLNFLTQHFPFKSDVDSSNICYEVALIREEEINEKVLSCNTPKIDRETQVYLSRGSIIQVLFKQNLPLTGSFLFQLKAAGCPLINDIISSKAQIFDGGSKVILRCNNTGISWTLTCVNGSWIGPNLDCTDVYTNSAQEQTSLTTMFTGNFTVLYGIFLAVSLGVTFGVFLGAILLVVVVLLTKKLKQTERKAPDELNNTSQYDCYSVVAKSSRDDPEYCFSGMTSFTASDDVSVSLQPKTQRTISLVQTDRPASLVTVVNSLTSEEPKPV